ncbi:MAG: hypothetical protein A3K19_04820 [Lentisphaerae bacterium RIFOXYB12_FULL_65_16]|nr:MAG: hypothetical protein A3K18_07835 [Lentisphaerae bacterium RIFOXYA12_64_32]OGV84054.1 MAG: hypothetical protein A3K19_04820 [Lentisphaerae bacterium RIFOXYB12_FULL_65_16]
MLNDSQLTIACWLACWMFMALPTALKSTWPLTTLAPVGSGGPAKLYVGRKNILKLTYTDMAFRSKPWRLRRGSRIVWFFLLPCVDRSESAVRRRSNVAILPVMVGSPRSETWGAQAAGG